jgi:pyruvate dehydrogenase E1 component beta subunit
MLKSAIRGRNPVLCFEDIELRQLSGEVPEGDYSVPIGKADIKRVGTDLTIVTLGASVHSSLAAAELIAADGISAEVIDLRTVVPLDRQSVLNSVAKTGHLIVVDPAPGMCSVASEVAATVAEHAFDRLRAPVIRLTAPQVPVPFSLDMEKLLYPSMERIAFAARRLCMAESGQLIWWADFHDR